MTTLRDVLTGAVPPGVHRLTARAAPAAVRRSVERAGWRCFYLDGREITDKASLLAAAATALTFPPYFGHNWDAFEECLRDLDWAPAPGYVILYDHAGRLAAGDPHTWATALDIFQEAARSWAAQGTPFYVLLRGVRPPVAPIAHG